MKNMNPIPPDDKTTALQMCSALESASAISLLTRYKSYLICNDDVVDTTKRRELQALLRRQGLLAPVEKLSASLADTLCSALTLRGIHVDQWLADRKFQNDLDELNRVINEYDQFGDLNANDTKLRIAVVNIVHKHSAELRKTLLTQPLDSSVHSAKIMKRQTKSKP
jgi:hypothetical protein